MGVSAHMSALLSSLINYYLRYFTRDYEIYIPFYVSYCPYNCPNHNWSIVMLSARIGDWKIGGDHRRQPHAPGGRQDGRRARTPAGPTSERTPPAVEDGVKADTRLFEKARERGREARFRLTVVPAYNYTCALTGYRLTTIQSGSIVDAAHIHQFSDSRNNHPQNGIALCKNAHWLFDQGLWSLTDDYEVIVAVGRFDEAGPDAFLLRRSPGRQIELPADRNYWPDRSHLAWHRKHKFQGG